MFDSLSELKKAKEEYDQILKHKGEQLVRSAIKEFFMMFPKVRELRWRQYTPYWNDGDPCIFRVSDPEVKIGPDEFIWTCPSHGDIVSPVPGKCMKKGCGRDLEHEIDEDNDGFVDSYSVDDQNLKNALKELDTAFSSCEDALLAAFGDHAKITATSNDIQVDEYEHE